jgi:hypothetical protein
MPASKPDKLLLLVPLLLLGHQSGLPSDWITSLPIEPGSLLGTAAANAHQQHACMQETALNHAVGVLYMYALLSENVSCSCRSAIWLWLYIWPASMQKDAYRDYNSDANCLQANMLMLAKARRGAAAEQQLFQPSTGSLPGIGLLGWKRCTKLAAAAPAAATAPLPALLVVQQQVVNLAPASCAGVRPLVRSYCLHHSRPMPAATFLAALLLLLLLLLVLLLLDCDRLQHQCREEVAVQ